MPDPPASISQVLESHLYMLVYGAGDQTQGFVGKHSTSWATSLGQGCSFPKGWFSSL